MKKKMVIVIVLVAVLVCFIPLPRKVDCKTESVQAVGWYLDFWLLTDRFYGVVEIDGNEYKPNDNYSAFKIENDDDCIYMIGVYRYRAEFNDVEGKTIYLEENLQDVVEWE